MTLRRLYVEKLPAYAQQADALCAELRDYLGLPELASLRLLERYDVEGLPEAAWEAAVTTVLAEPSLDRAHPESVPWAPDEHVFGVEYLPGQFDQRADSAAQCLQILSGTRPRVACARFYALRGALTLDALEAVKAYLINPVDSREASLDRPQTLLPAVAEPLPVTVEAGFREGSLLDLQRLHDRYGLSLSLADLEHIQAHFREAGRDPTETELKVLDTYWSDHCRHTTFFTHLSEVTFEAGVPALAPVRAAWGRYQALRGEHYGAAAEARPPTLMDLATLLGKAWRRQGRLPDLEVSEEINAASLIAPVEHPDGSGAEPWLIQFKNETHNHPTEIEPFGGAATCLGGAIRDPLAGRAYVYQALRVTGAADPLKPLAETRAGKLPQRRICRQAAEGFSSYGNQIGLSTGLVREHYHPGYLAKRLEIGAVVGAVPRAWVRREAPQPGDAVLLIGGRTGRDGIGGATGSSKAHTGAALESSAEVQKGDPPTERKLQRLFRREAFCRLVRRCNDFGAGGISVAVGELADGLEIDLDAVPLKYAGLQGTEIALSESQERMAVVVAEDDVARAQQLATAENLEATRIARVTEAGRLVLRWRAETLVDLPRAFLDTGGAPRNARVHVTAPDAREHPLQAPADLPQNVHQAWLQTLGQLDHASQRGLTELFDGSIGAGTVLMPLGGAQQLTPPEAMAACIPHPAGASTTATLMAYGFHPAIGSWSPFHGAAYAVVECVCRLVATGAARAAIRLSLQEYFPRLGESPQRWGLPLAALLGALTAQEALETPAVGGKDSMSGSYEDLDVPPTVVAFGIATAPAARVLSPEAKQAGNRILHVELPTGDDLLPDWAALRERLDALAAAIEGGQIVSARALRQGGLCVALTEMLLGNGLGLQGEVCPTLESCCAPAYGGFLLEVAPDADPALLPGARVLGTLTEAPALVLGRERWELEALRSAWEAPLEPVYPTRLSHRRREAPDAPQPPGPVTAQRPRPERSTPATARPRVLIPVFPGTNCEWDTAQAFARAGADPVIQVFRNLTDADVPEALEALAASLDGAQILALPGGFSAGDEPAGAGKFVASVFRQPAVAEATLRLLRERDGLILGICNGFQALLKLGLLPDGEIRAPRPGDLALLPNTLGRHTSRYARTCVAPGALRSPWFAGAEDGALYPVAVSHGEGRLSGPTAGLDAVAGGGQIATTYCDPQGRPALHLPDNPNGSARAIEGLLSPCGRVLGKMGHTERAGPHVAQNIPAQRHLPLFDAAVAWFR